MTQRQLTAANDGTQKNNSETIQTSSLRLCAHIQAMMTSSCSQSVRGQLRHSPEVAVEIRTFSLLSTKTGTEQVDTVSSSCKCVRSTAQCFCPRAFHSCREREPDQQPLLTLTQGNCDVCGTQHENKVWHLHVIFSGHIGNFCWTHAIRPWFCCASAVVIHLHHISTSKIFHFLLCFSPESGRTDNS